MRAAPERTLVFLPVAQYSGFFSVPRVPLHSREPVRRLLFRFPLPPLHARACLQLLFRFPLHAREPVRRLLCQFPLPSTRESLFAGSYSGFPSLPSTRESLFAGSYSERGPNLLYFIIFSMNGEKYWTVYEYILSFLFLLTYYLQSITKDTNAAYLLTSILTKISSGKCCLRDKSLDWLSCIPFLDWGEPYCKLSY